MAVKLYREYRIKFYLNMRHYIIINGNKGEVHPHTWEFDIKCGRSPFVEFNIFEKGISDFLDKYQNKILNDEEPFTSILPTLENVTDYFADEFFRIIHNIGGILTLVEASETPTRSYIINMEEQEELAGNNEETENKIMSDVIDAVVNEITSDNDNIS